MKGNPGNGWVMLVITSGCRWPYSTSIFFGRTALVEYDDGPNLVWITFSPSHEFH
jgi:hypothetical protein